MAGMAGLGGGGGGVDLTVSARPVTAAGLSGASSGRPVGPSRQVADKSYWQGELRSRLANITAESERLRTEHVTIAKENA